MNEAALLREPADATLEDARLASALVAPEAIDADDGESTPPAPLPLRPTGIDRGGLLDRVRRTCSRIAPLWPLKHFVAVNPFLGYADRDFESTVARLERVAGARALMPREWFRRHVDSGRITRADVVDALAQRAVATGERDVLAGLDADAILRRASAADAGSARRAPVRGALTYADAVDRAHGTQWARLATEEISKWCAAYFDEGQSAWRMPWRSLPLYSAWRAAAMRDRTPEVLGLAGFRAAVERLPDEPLATIAIALERLGLSAERSTDYLDRALASVAGWTAHARYREWQEQLHGAVDESPIRMLAIRLAWDAVLAELCGDEASRTAWRAACTALGVPDALDAEAATDAVLQSALEIAHARDLSARLAAHAAQATTVPRPEAQAVFCIDVRSEVYRRALETVAPTVATHGFAGFFGFALEYVRVGQPQGTDHCPALLKPAFVVRETVRDAAPAEERAVLALRAVRRRAAKAWKSFRTSAVSCFGYVESAGLAFGPKLLRDALGIARPAAATEGLDAHAIARLAPEIAPRADALHRADGLPRASGLALEQRIAAAAHALTAMGLVRDFARLVLLAGHGSTTANNPYGSGLDCGACGGHTGEANARVAAAVCNDPLVRAGLAERGIVIPVDTWFVAGLHDTTLDEMRLYDADRVPASHAADLARLRAQLARAGALARAERSAGLGIDRAHGADAAIRTRSRDWSEVRPEWGLAGNAAFVAAPRARTRGLELRGRAFLHDYDAARDPDGTVLELIMTAPMVVASWINLQYYGSTVDNAAFGSGNKTLHNVVGALGVLEGNGGDLRVGLPWQSVHDGRDYAHEPLRLGVWIEADAAAIERVLEKHPRVRELVDHGWIALHALRDDGRTVLRRANGGWRPLIA